MSSGPATDKELPARMQLFVHEYLCDLNASAAAVRAGYAPKNAGTQAGRLTRAPRVQASIDLAIAARCEALKIDAQLVVERLVAVATASIADFLSVGPDGTVQVDLESADPAKCAAVKKLEVVETKDGNRRVIIELCDKLKALELIGRHVGAERKA